LREVVAAKDAEIEALRAVKDAEIAELRALIGEARLRIAELERRQGLESCGFRATSSGRAPSRRSIMLTTEADSQAFLTEMREMCKTDAHIALIPLLMNAWKRRRIATNTNMPHRKTAGGRWNADLARRPADGSGVRAVERAITCTAGASATIAAREELSGE
jgi:hypothetical protein